MTYETLSKQHTPTPWRMYDAGRFSQLRLIVQDSIGYPLVAELIRQNAQENEANAAHIVRCVNAHDELVAALKQIVIDATNGYANECLDIARAALAKVQA